MVPAGAEIDDAPGGMDGVRIGVQRGMVDHDYLKANYPSADVAAYPGQDEVRPDLASGRLDAAFVGDVPASAFPEGEQDAGFEQVGEVHDDEAIYGPGAGIAVRKGDEALRAERNEALAAIRGNGEFARINEAYFDLDISGGI